MPDRYGLGDKRTLEQYAKFSGVDTINQKNDPQCIVQYVDWDWKGSPPPEFRAATARGKLGITAPPGVIDKRGLVGGGAKFLDKIPSSLPNAFKKHPRAGLQPPKVFEGHANHAASDAARVKLSDSRGLRERSDGGDGVGGGGGDNGPGPDSKPWQVRDSTMKEVLVG
jgi:hypothetical protein